MQWTDDAIVLGGRAHGEAAIILEVMTREHGRHLGIVHGGRSRRSRPVLQAGNTVSATWRARLDEHLGQYVVEAGRLRSAEFIGSAFALHAVGTLARHLRQLPERDPHPALYDAATLLLDRLCDAAVAPALFVRFELLLLAELGYGLDLATCAVTGASEDLLYVSPKSGRAVGRDPGVPYRDRLLHLPAFLTGNLANAEPTDEDVRAGFRLTGYFLEAYLYAPQGLPEPEERVRLVTNLPGQRQPPVSGMVPD